MAVFVIGWVTKKISGSRKMEDKSVRILTLSDLSCLKQVKGS